MSADLVLVGGTVATVDPDFRLAEGIVVRGGRIAFVGSERECRAEIGPSTRVIEIGGGMVLPGFIDSHAHLLDYGEALESLDLLGTKSFDEIVARVAVRVRETPKGEWIYGRGWNPELWHDPSYPLHDALSAISPDHPVVLGRSDGHAAIANAAAMRAAGIDARTQDPSDGQILRKPNGEPTGTFIENAQYLIRKQIPPLTTEQRRRMMRGAVRTLWSYGITGIHDAIEKSHYIDDFKALADQNQLGLRVAGMLLDLGEEDLDAFLARYRVEDHADGFFRLRCLRLLSDGGLGARGGALFEPYNDTPGHAGFPMLDLEQLVRAGRAAIRNDYHLCVHAIGDRAVSLVLDSYEQVLGEQPEFDHRFKVEHASLIADTDFARLGRLRAIASVQPTHVAADLPWIEQRLGPKRIERVLAFRRILEAGGRIACGSDFPVESPDVLLGIYTAVTRQTLDGRPEGGFVPSERLSLEQAIRGYTEWAAIAGFQDDIVGTIEPGKRADLVVLDRDLLRIDPHAIPTTRVLHTIVDGQVVHSA